MKKSRIVVSLIIVFALLMSCEVYSKEKPLSERLSNLGINKDMVKSHKPEIERSNAELKKISTLNPSRGESTLKSLFVLGEAFGYLSMYNGFGWVEDNKKDLKVTVENIKEALLKMGFNSSTAQSLDELNDLIDSAKTSSPAIETKLLSIYKEIEKWIVKEEGNDYLNYFGFGSKCYQCSLLTYLALNNEPKREKICKFISEEFLPSFKELKNEFEGDERMPGAAEKSLVTVVDTLGNMGSNSGDQEKNLKKINRAIKNICEAMNLCCRFRYSALSCIFQK